MKQLVYLAGPITGLTYVSSQDWRDTAARALNGDTIETLSPLRGKQFLIEQGKLAAHTYDGSAMVTNKGITRRDMLDTCRSTCVLVNLLHAERVSIGTAMELAWAYREHIPTIVVMEPGNLHEHAMVIEACTYIVPTLSQGIDLVKFLCNVVPKAECYKP